MEFTARQIAEFVHGTIEGDADVKISDISKIDEGKPGTITFLANPAYTRYIYTTQASIVLVSNDFVPEKSVTPTLIRVADPYQTLANLMQMYDQPQQPASGIDSLAFVHPEAQVGNEVYVGAFAYVGKGVKIADKVSIHPQAYIADGVEIGERTIIEPGVKIYRNCKIGSDCIIHAGAVIGSDGFGFAPKSQENFTKVPQLGNVVIEDLVEIGANTTIDRAALGSTVIERGVKLDNLIQVAHGVRIGENTVIAAQVGVSGSTKIGKNCMIAGQVGFAGHITVADGVMIGAQSGVSNHIKQPNIIVLGSPAIDASVCRKSYAVFRNLPSLDRKVADLERKLAELAARTADK